MSAGFGNFQRASDDMHFPQCCERKDDWRRSKYNRKLFPSLHVNFDLEYLCHTVSIPAGKASFSARTVEQTLQLVHLLLHEEPCRNASNICFASRLAIAHLLAGGLWEQLCEILDDVPHHYVAVPKCCRSWLHDKRTVRWSSRVHYNRNGLFNSDFVILWASGQQQHAPKMGELDLVPLPD